jgi:hypothetical protein
MGFAADELAILRMRANGPGGFVFLIVILEDVKSEI